jgi:hypothetical protein
MLLLDSDHFSDLLEKNDNFLFDCDGGLTIAILTVTGQTLARCNLSFHNGTLHVRRRSLAWKYSDSGSSRVTGKIKRKGMPRKD